MYSTSRCSTLAGSILTLEYYTKLNILGSDKHSSLFCRNVSDEEKIRVGLTEVIFNGATTLSSMPLSIMTLGIMLKM